MRTADARRSGLPPLGAVPAVGRAVLRAVAVVALVAGIVTMHSLGLGHRPMATGSSGHSMMAGTTAMVGMGASPAPQATTTMATVAEVVAEVADPAHGMAAMCLAVLPLLVLLLAKLLGWRVRSLTHAETRQGVRGFVLSNRAPPALLCPSLLKLCILRT